MFSPAKQKFYILLKDTKRIFASYLLRFFLGNFAS